MNNPPFRRLARDIRATRGCRAHPARHQRSRIADFVAGILARHARGVATLFGPERLTRRAPAPVAALHRHHHEGAATRLALHFELRLAPALRVRTGRVPFLPWRVAPQRDAAPPAGRAPGRSLVQRIAARERRVEIGATMAEVLRAAVARQLQHTDAPPVARAKPVEMVARRPRAPVPEMPRATPAAAPGREMDERGARLNLARPAAIDAALPLSASELGRVTDQVVRAIDRRFVAQRERRGRI